MGAALQGVIVIRPADHRQIDSVLVFRTGSECAQRIAWPAGIPVTLNGLLPSVSLFWVSVAV